MKKSLLEHFPPLLTRTSSPWNQSLTVLFKGCPNEHTSRPLPFQTAWPMSACSHGRLAAIRFWSLRVRFRRGSLLFYQNDFGLEGDWLLARWTCWVGSVFAFLFFGFGVFFLIGLLCCCNQINLRTLSIQLIGNLETLHISNSFSSESKPNWLKIDNLLQKLKLLTMI